MNSLSVCFVFVAVLVMEMIIVKADQTIGSLSVPDPQSFNDPQSALTVESNLQSQRYQDFIQTLYRHDKDNLNRVNTLFAQAGSDHSNLNNARDNTASNNGPHYDTHQLSYADYVKAHPFNYIGITQDSSKRLKRYAHGAIFRPLFVYRIFQERQLEREENRRRRLQGNRGHAFGYSQNEFEY